MELSLYTGVIFALFLGVKHRRYDSPWSLSINIVLYDAV